jgi:hypothetical protein
MEPHVSVTTLKIVTMSWTCSSDMELALRTEFWYGRPRREPTLLAESGTEKDAIGYSSCKVAEFVFIAV